MPLGSLFALSDSDSQRIRIGQHVAQLRKESRDVLGLNWLKKIGTKQHAITRIEKGF